MTAPEPIICKPTAWFKVRASAMLAMFAIFAVMFYIDGTSGYRKKNEVYYMYATFRDAGAAFANRKEKGIDTPEAWESWAATQSATLPDDLSILPESMRPPLPWPDSLVSYESMDRKEWRALWLDYSKANELSSEPPDDPYDAGKIGEQMAIFWGCVGLSAVTLFILIRTLRRTTRADEFGITAQDGRFVAYQDMTTLDLRKWDGKGLAFIKYKDDKGAGRLRIDALTYGGFKVENGQPAEQLLSKLRENFTGEIIEYAPVKSTSAEPAAQPADPEAPVESDDFPRVS